MNIEFLQLPEWALDALLDSFQILPFLFIVFVIIELVEYFYANKINTFMSGSKKAGPVVGSLISIVPQCGFSIIASTLYTRKLISRGTLIAIYLATSDEAIPVLLANPAKIYLILPIILIKLVVAIVAGYLVDLIFKNFKQEGEVDDSPLTEEELHEEGCCKHDIISGNKNNLWLHPIIHTLNVFIFILLITFILNYFVSESAIYSFFSNDTTVTKFLEPALTALLGLIPNCAISIALTMMLIKGTISFGAAMAGLLSNAGLGLLVLIRKNSSLKDSALIILSLFVISVICGIIL